MSTETTLKVTEIQRFCMHDGPGIRTTVFLKGCPLRCAWCHNPETQKSSPELLFYAGKCISCGICEAACPNGVHTLGNAHTLLRENCAACGACAENCPTAALSLAGREITVAEIIAEVAQDSAFYGEDGGVTLSGGEPFLHGEKTVDLICALHEAGFSVAVETCGYADPATLLAAVPHTSLFLWDIKDTDSARHRQYTGVPCERILDNLRAVDAAGGKTRLRCILVHGVNTEKEHYRRLGEIAASLQNCEGVEFLPYHAYGGTKTVFLGGKDSGNATWIPTEEEVREAKETVADFGVKVF